MRCEHCSHTTEYHVKFCPECGYPAPSESAVPGTVQPSEKNHYTAYTRMDYDPRRDGRPLALSPAAAGDRPSSTGMIVFSVINMVFLGLGFSFVLGCIALVLTLTSGSEPNPDIVRGRISTARTLNIVGLIFILLQTLLIFIGLFVFVVLIRKTAYIPG